VRTFKDTEAREWTVKITVSTVKRVRDLIGVDLMDTVKAELIQEMHRDPVLLASVIFAVCKPQADERGLTVEQFDDAMGGDVVQDASNAFFEALIDFFPAPRRGLLKQIMEKIKALEALAIEAAGAKLNSGEFEKAVTDLLAGPLSIATPESSE